MCLQERGLGAKCSEGKMRDERVESMGAVFIDGRMKQSVDEFQRDLEIEVANHLREQNAKLLLELEWYRKQKLSSDSGMGSNSSWVEVATGDGEKRAVGSCGNGGQNGQECNTPRGGVTGGSISRYTPNGTRIPDGMPPDDEPNVGPPVFLPPVPPFPNVLK